MIVTHSKPFPPVIALHRYPHVIERLEALWGHPEFCNYTISILLTDRPHRDGFNNDAWRELTMLRDLHFLYTSTGTIQ